MLYKLSDPNEVGGLPFFFFFFFPPLSFSLSPRTRMSLLTVVRGCLCQQTARQEARELANPLSGHRSHRSGSIRIGF